MSEDDDDYDSEYVEVMSQIGNELIQIWDYLEKKYEVPGEFLIDPWSAPLGYLW